MNPIVRACLVLCLVASLDATAAAQSCPPIQIRNADGNYIVPGVQGDIPYSGNLALDAYVQPGASSRPSVVVIHGGGWSAGSRVAHVGQLLEVLTTAGYNWFSVDYRLGGPARFEESAADVRAALAFIRCHAKEFGVDADRLILLGEDTGAQLAAQLAASRPSGVTGAILIGGYYDRGSMAALEATLDTAVPAAPASRTASAAPPVLIVHGTADSEAPFADARSYCERITSGGGRCHVVAVEGASHRSENWYPSQWGYKREIVDWMASSGHRVDRAAPKPETGRLLKNILYSPKSGLGLDAFLPVSRAAVPAVIVVHGGGWEAGDKVTYVSPLFEPLSRAGLAWFSIDYRLTPAFTLADQLDDVREAIRFVRENHARFNIDPRRIVLLGESASGQLVTQLAAVDGMVAGVVSFYGVYDFESMVTDASPRSLLVRLFRRAVLDDAARAELRGASPLFTAHRNMPPILLVNGTGERLWGQAQAFDKRLTELGVPHDVIALDGAPHGVENWEGHPEWTTYKRQVTDWILRTAAAAPPSAPLSR
jgi:alpha-L-fucosidase 2